MLIALVVAVVLMLVPVVATPAVAQPLTGQKIQETWADSIVYIQVKARFQDNSEDTWSGTGFIVQDKGYLITNAHVAGDPAQYRKDSLTIEASLRSRLLPKLPVEVVKREPDLDLALLKLPYVGQPYKPVRIGDSNSLAAGQNIFVLGFPAPADLTFTPGTLSALHALRGRLQASASINRGDSGGPVFDDRGDVVAVVFGGLPAAAGISYVIPINYARGLLRLVGAPW